MRHKPVLLREAVQSLNLKPGAVVLDGTLGSGGHALELAGVLGPQGRLIALDQDAAAIERCREKFKSLPWVVFEQANFRNADQVLAKLDVEAIDAALLDIGFSSDQLEDAERGFSFDRPGPLDMRMNSAGKVTAADLVRDLSQVELEHLFIRYAEERWARKIALRISEVRKQKEIRTTDELVRTIEMALPRAYSYPPGRRPPWARHHPATRVFQALRIAVNDELGSLTEALPKIFDKLKPGGRLSVITFHSLEDRIVKHQFKDWHLQKMGTLVTKKPVEPTEEEVEENSRSRSAKLRTIEKR